MARAPSRSAAADAVQAAPWWSQVLGADPRSLALLRIGLGLLVIADLVARGADLRAHYTDFGLLPRGPLVSHFMNGLVVCLHLATGTWGGTLALFVLQGVCAALLVVGLHSRAMAVASWALMYSLHLRNPMVLQGGDDLLRMLLFWSMFVPLGRCYSVDAALARGALVPTSRGDAAVAAGPWTPHVSVGTAALLVQVLLMYFGTALLKTGREWHAEGSAVYYALHFDQLALPLALQLRQFYPLTQLLTHLTLGWESVGPLLLVSPIFFGPLRTLAAALFCGMHFAFAACLMLGLFPYIDLVSMLMLLPGWAWQRLAGRLDWQRQTRLTIVYDGECDVCRKFCLVLCEALLLRQVPLLPAQTRPALWAQVQAQRSWLVLEQGREAPHAAWGAFAALLAASPLTGWAAAPLGRGAVGRAGTRLYYAVSGQRPRLAKLSARLLPWRPAAPPPGPLLQALAAVALALVLNWNLSSWPGVPMHVPAALRPLAYMFRLDQDWGMFAPCPMKEDGWYVIAGRTVDGHEVDVWRNTPGAPDPAKPALVSAMYPNQRWSKYFMNIWLARNADYRLYFGQYLCRRANGPQPLRRPDALAEFEIAYYKEMTLPKYEPSAPVRVGIWKHYCFEVPKGS